MEKKNYLKKIYLKKIHPRNFPKNRLKNLPKNLQNCMKNHLKRPQKSSKNHPRRPQQIQKNLPKKHPNPKMMVNNIVNQLCHELINHFIN